jgi:hypothetical protein
LETEFYEDINVEIRLGILTLNIQFALDTQVPLPLPATSTVLPPPHDWKLHDSTSLTPCVGNAFPWPSVSCSQVMRSHIDKLCEMGAVVQASRCRVAPDPNCCARLT